MMNHWMNKLFVSSWATALLLALMSCAPVYAGGLSAPFTFDSAATLPKGVRNVRLGGLTTEAKTFFDMNGDAQVLGAGLSKKITYDEMINSLKDPDERADYRAAVQAKGLALSDSAGESTGIVTARVNVAVPVLAYGVTDFWTTALAVPIVSSEVSVDTGFKADPGLNQLVQKMYAEGNREEMNHVTKMMQNVVAYKAAVNSYQPVQNQKKTELGDLNLVNKFRLMKEENYAVALISTVVLPTGKQADINKIVDIGAGSGAYAVGAGVASDYYLDGHWTTTGSLSYTAQLPGTVARRIPFSREETLSADIDNNTYRDLGDIIKTAAGLKYKPWDDWNFGTAYSFQYKAQDTYRGSQYELTRYSLLEDNTQQMMHAAQVGVGYSTVNKYLKQQAAVPFEANVGYTAVIAGQNVARDDIASLEMVLFF